MQHKLILSTLSLSLILALSLQFFIKNEQKVQSGKEKFTNPLYEEFTNIAKEHDLNLAFTKDVWIQRGEVDYKVSAIFDEKPNSVDILLLGDSSISWGLIPQVLEQITGKNVAMYAYESNLLTQKTAQLFDKITSYYLKEDGMVIFSFDNWTKRQHPNDVRFSKEECEEMLTWSDKDFAAHAKANEKSLYQTYLSLDAYKRLYNNTSEYLKSNYALGLSAPSLYANHIEKFINPSWHAKKSINAHPDDIFIRWDIKTVTIYNPDRNATSIYSDAMPPYPMKNKNIQTNAKAASKIHAHKRVYMVPLYAKESSYVTARNIYQSYYKELGFELCDLGLLHPKESGYSMQKCSHMANTGGLQKSILIAQWLKNYYKTQR